MAKITKIELSTLRTLRANFDADTKLVTDSETIIATLPADSAALPILKVHAVKAAERVKMHEAAITRFIFKAVVKNPALFDTVTAAVEKSLAPTATRVVDPAK
jgi:hypothetical protein